MGTAAEGALTSSWPLSSLCVSVCVKDDEGKTGPFLDEIKKWVQQQKEQYVAEIKEQLGDTR